MRIKKIISQHRRDFKATFECEGCGHEIERGGYDDDHFHAKVIPGMECPKCGETALSLNSEYRPLTTKYPEGFQV